MIVNGQEYIYIYFLIHCHHMSILDFVVTLLVVAEVGTPTRRSYVVLMRWMVIYEYEVPGGALNLILLITQTMVTMGILPYQGEIPMVKPGIEPGTSRLVV
jgi:hypothetical protein